MSSPCRVAVGVVVVAAGLVGPGAFPAAAQDLSVQEARDLQFARRLIDYRYEDLAETFLGRIEAAGHHTEEAAAQLAILHVDLLIAQASDASDVDRKLELLDEARGSLERFLKDHEQHAFGAEARVRVGDLLRQKADYLLEALRDETDAGRIAKLREQGVETVNAAKRHFIRIRDEAMQRLNMDPESGDDELAAATFQLPRLDYMKTRFLPKGDAERIVLLQDAYTQFDEFAFNYGDRPLVLDCLYFQALVLRDQGELDAAVDKLQDVIEPLVTGIVDPQNADFGETDEGGKVLLVQALLDQGRIYQNAGHPEQAAQIDAEIFEYVPEVMGAELGWEARYEQGRALLAAGQEADGRKILSTVAARGPEKWSRKAQDLGVTIASADTSELGAEVVLRSAIRALQEQDWDTAIEQAGKAAAKAREEGGPESVLADAAYVVGFSHMRRGELPEAVRAFRESRSKHPTQKRAAESTYLEITCLNILIDQEPSDDLQKQYEDALEVLTTTYKSSIYAGKVQLFAAKKFEKDGRYDDARREFGKFEPNSPNYGEGQAGVARCATRQALRLVKDGDGSGAKRLLEEALGAYGRALAWARKEKERTLDSSAIADAEDLIFDARAETAKLYLLETLGRTREALDLIHELQNEYKGQAARLEQLLPIEFDALVKAGKVNEAAVKLDQLLDRNVQNPAIPKEAFRLAVLLDNEGHEEFAKDPNDLRAVRKLRQAARYYEASTHDFGKTRQLLVSDLRVPADRILAIGLDVHGVEPGQDSVIALQRVDLEDTSYWSMALPLYEQLLGSRYRDVLGEDRVQIVIKLGTCYGIEGKFDRMVRLYERLMRDEGFVKQTGGINARTASKNPALLFAYLDLGFAYEQTGETSSSNYNFAKDIFASTINTTRGQEALDLLWWEATYHYIHTLYLMGDLGSAKAHLSRVEREYPDLDGGKYGIKERFRSLKPRLR